MNETQEYSLFLESGCKNTEVSKNPVPLYKYQAFDPEQAPPQIQGVNVNDFEKIVNRNKVILADRVGEEEREQEEFAVAIAELAVKKLTPNLEVAEFDREISEIKFENEAFKEIEFIGETAFAEFCVESCEQTLPEQIHLDQTVVTDFEIEELRDFEMLILDLPFADSTVPCLSEGSDLGKFTEIAHIERVDDPESEFEAWVVHFDGKEAVERAENGARIDEIQPEIELIAYELESVGFENIEREVAAAESDGWKIEADLIPTECRAQIAGKNFKLEMERVISEFEIVGFGEIPNTEGELAAAESDLRRFEGTLSNIPALDIPKGVETPMLLGGAEIADRIEPYLESPLTKDRAEIAGKSVKPEVEQVLTQFETVGFQEIPDADRELAASEADVKKGNASTLATYEDPKGAENPMMFGEAVIADRVESYSGSSLSKDRAEIAGKSVKPEVEQVLTQFETVGFQEIPDADRELATSEADVKKGNASTMAAYEEPKGAENPMMFGEAVIADRVESYSELSIRNPSSEIAGKSVKPEVEQVLTQFETVGFQEIPDADRELATSEADVKKGNASTMAAYEEPKGAENPMMFGEAVIADRVESYSELSIRNPSSEIAGKSVKPEVEQVLTQFETVGFQEIPDADRELAASEADVKKGKASTLAAYEDPKGAENPMMFGEAVIADRVESYSELSSRNPSSEIAGRSLNSDKDQVISDIETVGFEEIPSIEKEVVVAEPEVKEPSLNTVMAAVLEAIKESDSTVASKREENKAEPIVVPVVLHIEIPQVIVANGEDLADAAAIKEKIKNFFSAKKEEEKIDVDDWDPYPWPKRITVRHLWGYQEKDCIPLATNYTTLEIFTAPDYRPGHMFPFLDLRGHRFDNNTYAGSAGVGGRFVPRGDSGFCEILGFNVCYDYRQGCIGYYQQVGAGIEVLGRRWDFRANAYAPFGARRHIHTCVFDEYVGEYYAIRRDIESVSYSFNGEVGYRIINGVDYSLYVAAGPYFLARGKCSTSTPGIEGRIRPQYKDYLAIDLSARYDDLFGTILQAEFIFNLPLYQISKRNKRACGLRDWQIYQPVERFEVMPLSKKSCWETNF